jgi:hypothetical protein
MMTELASVRDRFISSMLPARARRNVEWTTSCARRTRTTTR